MRLGSARIGAAATLVGYSELPLRRSDSVAKCLPLAERAVSGKLVLK